MHCPCLLCSVNHHSLNQSDVKITPLMTWLLAYFPHFRRFEHQSRLGCPRFSRALGGLFVCSSSSHWFFRIFSFLKIGSCDYFRFGFYDIQSKSALITEYRKWKKHQSQVSLWYCYLNEGSMFSVFSKFKISQARENGFLLTLSHKCWLAFHLKCL